MVSLRTHALVAVAAWHVAEQHPARDLPWRMLWIRQRVEVNNWGADGCGEMSRPGIVRHQDRCLRHQRGELAEVKPSCDRVRARHRCADVVHE